MKKPQDCEHINDVRSAIDEIDKNIIQLIGKRATYVRKAADFKKSEEDVKGAERVKSMIEVRRDWALAENIHPDIIEKIYRDLVSYFINEELYNWKNK